jgi:hypothetical protein
MSRTGALRLDFVLPQLEKGLEPLVFDKVSTAFVEARIGFVTRGVLVLESEVAVEANV